jgi:recombination protein RecA
MTKKEKSSSDISDDIKQTSKKKMVVEMPRFLPTGVTLLDLVLGGGIQVGTIFNVVGDTSSGKTYLAVEAIIYWIKIYFKKILNNKYKIKLFYDDCEGGFSFDTKEMYGVDLIPTDQTTSSTVEEFGVNLKKLMNNLSEDEFLVYVVDSLDGLSSEAERERDDERQKAVEDGKKYDKGTYAMEKQKYMSQFFRLRAAELKHKNAILIIISQVRHNINAGLFGEKYLRAGGKALDFYASVCLWLAGVEKKVKKERVIGTTIKAWTKKAKVVQPFRNCFFDLIFDYGIDNVTSNINFLYDLKTPQGKDKESKVKLQWEEVDYTKPGLVRHIEENNLEEELAKKVIEKWNAIEDSISSKERKCRWE